MTQKNGKVEKRNPPEWIFGNLNGGMRSGENDGPTVGFRGPSPYHIAREAIQNAMDAKITGSKEPVRVEFEVKKIKASTLPGYEYLENVLSGCARYLNSKASKNGSEKGGERYRAAADRINKDKFIKVLRISDYNTTGMTEDNWYRFACSKGLSSKDSGSGGSFGLGKGAYFESSGFKTLYISSLYKDKKVDKYRFAGKAIVATFEIDGIEKQANGTYGIGMQDPISEKETIPVGIKKMFPEAFNRTETGTDFLITDYTGDEKWDIELTQSILRYFWLPIHEKALVVRINNEVLIDSSNLLSLLNAYFPEGAEFSKGEDFNPRPFYDAYLNGDKISEKLSVLGEVNLHLLIGDDYPKLVAMIRKPGMVVRLDGKRNMTSFIAVFRCKSEKGNEILREMENQAHNEWRPENARPESRKLAGKAKRQLDKFIIEQIRKINIADEQEYMYLEGLEQFITIESNEGHGEGGEKSDENVNETGDIRTAESYKELFSHEKAKTRELDICLKSNAGPGADEATAELNFDGGNGGGDGEIGKKKAPLVDAGKQKGTFMKNLRFRSFASGDRSRITQHYIHIKGDPDKVIDALEVLIGTDDKSDKIGIRTVAYADTKKSLEMKESIIQDVKLDSNGERKIQLEFQVSGKYSLKCFGYED